MKLRRKTNLCEQLEEEVGGAIVEAEVEDEQGEEGERVQNGLSFVTPPRANRSKCGVLGAAEARQVLDSKPVAEFRYADLNAVPADVWVRIANMVVKRGECCCSWPLVACAIAMSCVRRALLGYDTSLVFYEECQCPPSAVSLPQQIRSFAWLCNQHPSPSQFIYSLTEAPPRLFSSLLRSCLFPSISSITSLDLYLSRSLHSNPRLLLSLSQAPRLESLLITHGVASDSDHGIPRLHCNDAVLVAEMWEMISVIEEKKPGDTDIPFPVLSHLSLSLPACSPLILRFVSCLSAQLQYLSLGAADQFAAQEGKEGAESGDNAEGRRGGEGDMDERNLYSLHLPLATNSRHSRLLLLPTCPAHLTSLFLRSDRPSHWPLHAPHLTSLESLCTNMQPEEAAYFPPGVIATV
ncbi:unnamed protein product [Closterium sp. Naga37s-1]|nr:unnamed protein product [Closterium sp. Naga37s-1]